MNYEEAVAYIDETPKFTKKNSLDHTKECLRRLGNPQDKFKVIHVAGTNGKGSTCAFLTSVLREAGYSCGLFTSPHLVEINERFQINEVNIDNDTFLKAFEKVKVLADELVAEGSYHPTYFEMLFLMGMVIFAEAGVDYVTLETGLGGRMDATTAVENPVACVITSISLDHMQYLGDTVAKIAGEKAGIVVPGVPVIYDGNDPDAAEVIRARAEELGSPAYEVNNDRESKNVIDIGTGTGAIAISLKLARPMWQVTAVDISAAALKVAKENAETLQAVIDFKKSDVLSGTSEKYDVIISNPPYISQDEWDLMDESVRTYEPKTALFAEKDGLAIYQKIALESRDHLKIDGMIFLEIGFRQGIAVKEIFQTAFPEKKVSIHQDMSGNDRMVVIA